MVMRYKWGLAVGYIYTHGERHGMAEDIRVSDEQDVLQHLHEVRNATSDADGPAEDEAAGDDEDGPAAAHEYDPTAMDVDCPLASCSHGEADEQNGTDGDDHGHEDYERREPRLLELPQLGLL